MSGGSPARRGLGGLTARIAALALAACVIVGPLLSLVLWSLAERWTYPAAWPQRLGFRYWSRMLTADFLDPLKTGLGIAAVVTMAALLCAVPLGYALARLRFPGRTLVLLAFLLPQAFPQLPVFAVWTMAAVFRAMDPALEEAAHNLGASATRAFVTVSLPLAVPGIVASALLVFLYSLDEFTGTLLVGAPFVTTLPVYMYTASQGYEMQIASVTALVLMAPGVILLLLLERVLRAEYLTFFGQL